jgi:hypothetical protein
MGEWGRATTWPGGEKDMQERERLKETAHIRAPQGLAGGSLNIRLSFKPCNIINIYNILHKT